MSHLPRLPICLSFAACPAVPAAVWLALGATAVCGPCLGGLPAVPCIAATLLAALVFALAQERSGRRQAWLFPVGALLAGLHLWAPWLSYRAQLPGPACGAELEAVVVDATILSDAVPWAAPVPSVTVRVRRVRPSGSDNWRPGSGLLLLRTREPQELPYGAVVRATGVFTEPDRGWFPGDFDYRRYLRCTGIRQQFVTDAAEIAETVSGWRRLPATVYGWRDRLVAGLSRNLADDQHAQLLAAVVLGVRQNFAPEVRRQFLRSGTIHVFSVSGLHVVILAGILVLFLRLLQVPFRWRYLLLPVLLGVYVFMTGNSPPAVRAWVMISVWAVARGWFLALAPLNSVAVAFVILLVLNPLSLLQTGFQFSFTLVALLVLGWHATAEMVAAAFERERWIPLRCRSYGVSRWLARGSLQALAGGTLAWFASTGLIAFSNGLIIPAAVVVNAGISFVAWLVLFLATLKGLFLWWPGPWLDVVLASGIDPCLSAMTSLAELGSQPGACLSLPRPPLWLVGLYYLTILAWCLPSRLLLAVVPKPADSARAAVGRRQPDLAPATVYAPVRAWAAVGTVLALLAFFYPWRATPTAAVFYGAGVRAPAIVLRGVPGGPPLLLNTGGPEVARHVTNWLGMNGASELEMLVFTGTSREFAGGAAFVAQAVPPRTVLLPSGRGREVNLLAALPGTAGAMRQWPPENAGASRLRVAGVELTLAYNGEAATNLRLQVLPGTGLVDMAELTLLPLCGARLRLTRAGQSDLLLRIPIAREPRLAELP